jgi:rhodanese-related sulfurtransferase
MSMTINAAANDLRKAEDVTLDKAAAMAASATLRGARGNSGVILSLLLRGISKKLKGAEECDGILWAAALKEGVDAAYKAVMKPAEGTILTVARLAAVKAQRAAKENNSVEFVQKAAIKEAVDKMPEGGRVVIVCVSGNMLAKNAMAALQDAGADLSKVTYLIGGFGTWSKNYPVVAPDKKSVSVPAWVANDGIEMIKKDDGTFATDLTHHILVNKNGSNAPSALLNTEALPIQVYDALQMIGSTPSDKFNKADAFEADGKTPKTGAKLDSAAEKLNVEFAIGDKTATLSDLFFHVKTQTADVKTGAAIETEPYVADMRFSGGLENIKDKFDNPSGNQTGCITCTFSCWIGTVSNMEYGYNTQEAMVNRANVPAAGTAVTVIYTRGE